ncbi:MAG: glucose-1-phosphate adenylyltransferase [Pseudomonadota bacterium]
MPRVLTMILSGGEGQRLYPLTKDRAKSAVTFGGIYKIIDIILSNFVNSGLMKIKVITQYKSHSLDEHIARAWKLSPVLDNFIETMPAQQRLGKDWFKGSADAVFQCLNVIEDENPENLCIFGGDHIYAMDIRQVLDFHVRRNADCTISVIPKPAAESTSFGVVVTGRGGQVIGFQEKPQNPKTMVRRPGEILASMGNYIFKADVLKEAITQDAMKEESTHDFGKNILPALLEAGKRVLAYDFSRNEIEGHSEHNRGYWRDVGTIDSFHEANMDLVSYNPCFNLYNPNWPVRALVRHLPPAKFVHTDEASERVGSAMDSMVGDGSIVSGGKVIRSILSPGVRINSFSLVKDSILFDGVKVGRGAELNRVIVDKEVFVPPGIKIGRDHDQDRKKGFFVSPGGIVVVSKRQKIE